MELQVDLKGFPELLKRLQAMAGPQQRRAMQDGLKAGAFILEGEFKVASPVDTGFMRNAIYVRGPDYSGYQDARSSADSFDVSAKTGRKVNHAGDFHPESGAPDELQVKVCFGAEYTAYVEANEPFIQPAFTRGKDEALKAIRVTLERGIK